MVAHIRLLVQLSLLTGVSVWMRWKWTSVFRMQKFGLKKRQTSFHSLLQSTFWYLKPLRRDSRDLQTERETDRHCNSKCHSLLRCSTKNYYRIIM